MKASIKSPLPVVVLVLSSILWGLVWWPLQAVHGWGMDGIPLIAIAHAGVSLVLLPFLFMQYAAWAPAWPWMLGIALIGGAANVAFNAALLYGDVVRTMVLFYLLPVWGVLGGRIFLGEKIDFQRVAGMLLALLGAYIMLGASPDMFVQFSGADLLALASGLLFAMNNILFRRTDAVPVMSKITALFIGGLLFAVAALMLDVSAVPSLTPKIVGAALALGVGWWLLATLGSQWAVTRLEAGRAAVIMVLELVTAVVSSALLGARGLLPYEIAGITLVLVATLLEGWRSEDTPTSHETQIRR